MLVYQHAGNREVGQRARAHAVLAGQLPRDPVQPGEPIAELDDGISHAHRWPGHTHRRQRWAEASVISETAGLECHLEERPRLRDETLDLSRREAGMTDPQTEGRSGLSDRDRDGGQLAEPGGADPDVVEQLCLGAAPAPVLIPVGGQQVTRCPDRRGRGDPRRRDLPDVAPATQITPTHMRQLVDEPRRRGVTRIRVARRAYAQEAGIGSPQLHAVPVQGVQQVPVDDNRPLGSSPGGERLLFEVKAGRQDVPARVVQKLAVLGAPAHGR